MDVSHRLGVRKYVCAEAKRAGSAFGECAGGIADRSRRPAGVFNIVHGDKECVDALLTHPLVRAVSFVGSTGIAQYVYETGAEHGKRVQAAGGAKNHLIIMPDADLDQAARHCRRRRLGAQGNDAWRGRLRFRWERLAMIWLVEWRTGRQDERRADRWDRRKCGHGPADYRAASRSRRFLFGHRAEGRSERGGRWPAKCSRRRVFSSAQHHRSCAAADARYQGGDFRAVLSVIRVNKLEDALEVGRQCPYGNGASIFTKSGWAAREFKQHFNAGMIGINVGVPAPMAWFPFTGWNRSFFGDLHIQGREAVQFYTRQRRR